MGCGFVYAGEEEKKGISKADKEHLEYFVGEWDLKMEQEGKPTQEASVTIKWGKSEHCLVAEADTGTWMSAWSGKPGRFVELVSFRDGGHVIHQWKRKSSKLSEAVGKGVSADGSPIKTRLFHETLGPNRYTVRIEDHGGGEKQPDVTATFTRKK
jgi:hypothetical protein